MFTFINSYSYKRLKLKILKEETFRSKPLVNMTDDMVRVTISFTRREWHKVKRILGGVSNVANKPDTPR